MKIDWECEENATDVYGEFFSLAAACAQSAEGVQEDCAVHVLLTNDEGIRRYNREQRNIDRSTDVLSFPTVNYPSGLTAKDCPLLLKREYDDDAGGCMLGDVIISIPHAKAQAQEYGHSVQRELGYLLVHALFHLFGYDHMEAEDQIKMRQMEEKALQMAGLTRDGQACPSDEALLLIAREAMQRAYAPYSHYPVGACLLCEDGRTFTGCNVENASYGLSNCAERTALFKAVSEGETSFTAIAIAAKASAPWPCGACRQALTEFAPDLRVLVTWDGGSDESTLGKLLPNAFGPKSLE